MGSHVVIQPLGGYGAAVVLPPWGRQLVAGSAENAITIQVRARIAGLLETARFARSLAKAANEFGDWGAKEIQPGYRQGRPLRPRLR
jgi:hypothetical protein